MPLLDRLSQSNGVFVQLLPWALLCGGIAINTNTPPTITFTPIFTAAPLVAAALLSFRATLLNAVGTTVGVSAMLLLRDPQEDAGERVVKILTVITVALLALAINIVLQRRKRQLASARTISEAVQRAIVPEPPPRVGELRVATRYRASRQDHQVGGDFYSVVESPYGTRMILGDVRGKGLAATESVAVVLGAFRESAEYEPGLAALAGRLDSALARAARLSTELDETEEFVTAILAQVNQDTPESPLQVQFINRGHPPPLVLTANRTVHPIEPDHAALPLGTGLTTSPPAAPSRTTLPIDATLLLYTDGMTEARDKTGAFYDPVQRLTGSAFTRLDQLLDWLTNDVTRYARGTDDDMALLAVRYAGQPVPGATTRTNRPTAPKAASAGDQGR